MMDEKVVEEMARAIAKVHVPASNWDMTRDPIRGRYRDMARAALSRLDSLGYAVVPKSTVEVRMVDDVSEFPESTRIDRF